VTIARTLSQSIAAVGALTAAWTLTASALDISGAGATFPYPIYAKWADAYRRRPASE
jgi:phosphate transport system substrate-binding protein